MYNYTWLSIHNTSNNQCSIIHGYLYITLAKRSLMNKLPSLTLLYLQVQVRTWTCNGHVTCNCAVAVKEGNDVIILDMCHTVYGTSYPRLYIPHQGALSQGTTVDHDSGSNNWIVKFALRFITIRTRSINPLHLLYIYILNKTLLSVSPF